MTMIRNTQLSVWLGLLERAGWDMSRASALAAASGIPPMASTATKPSPTAPRSRQAWSILRGTDRVRAQAVENRQAVADARRGGELDLPEGELRELWSDVETQKQFAGDYGKFAAYWRAVRRGQVRR